MSEEKVRKASWRMGARESRLAVNAIVGLIIVGLVLVLQPYYRTMVQTRDWQTCQSNAQVIAKAIQTYAADWDDGLPPGSAWLDNIYGNLAPRSGSGFKPEDYVRCPRDKSTSNASYAYNDILGGLSLGVQKEDAEAEARIKQLGTVGNAVMVIEKHGVDRNAHFKLDSWDRVKEAMSLSHETNVDGKPVAGGTIILANGSVLRRTVLQFEEGAGQKFDGSSAGSR